ncbi:MAG: RloB family protein [Bacteroidota bacterium]
MARKRNFRPTSYQIAVIGEGETEWHYFNNVRTRERFPFSLSPQLPTNSDYRSIFAKAIQFVKEGWDLIYCVLDTDTIFRSQKLKQDYIKEKKRVTKYTNIVVIESMPCIEYWFLIHYTGFSTKLYPNFKSLQAKLKLHLKGYQKTSKYFKSINLYKHLTQTGSLTNAIGIAQRLRHHVKQNPDIRVSYSDLDLIFQKLHEERSKRKSPN